MLHKHTRPLLALLFLILASLACTATNYLDSADKTFGKVVCKDKYKGDWFAHYFTDDDFYSCSCPSSPISNVGHGNWTFKELETATVEDMEKIYCAAPSADTATSTPGATPTATSTPTKRPTATPAPYLSGEVTTCNLTDRYINFPIDPNAADISGFDFEVTIGGVPSTCNVPSSNPNILSCTFPTNQTFPAQIIVNVDGSITNNFTFDGGICASNPVPQENNGGGDSVPPVEPSPTEDLTSG